MTEKPNFNCEQAALDPKIDPEMAAIQQYVANLTGWTPAEIERRAQATLFKIDAVRTLQQAGLTLKKATQAVCENPDLFVPVNQPGKLEDL